MSSEQNKMDAAQHRRVAVECFNSVWKLLEKPDRTPEEDDTMLHMAHASRYHWGILGAPVNLARGEWQVSRVYAVLGRPEPARYHANRCLDICEANGIGDFDLAYAYEALARACAIAGERSQREIYLQKAIQAGEQIAKTEDRELLELDLTSIPRI